jgi:hypothetical protein
VESLGNKPPMVTIESVTPSTTGMTTDIANGEAVSGLGLFLSVAAIIAVAIGLAGLSLGHLMFALAGGIAAVVGFAGSMACFVADTRRYEVRSARVA